MAIDEIDEEDNMIAFTKAGVILPTTSGSLSFVSSCLIMITILRSKQNTPYHRIMFFMSFWDSIASLSMALTTIPMPKDVEYDYAGPSYGNITTCEAQAFVIVLSSGLVLLSSILLSIYYICTIRYNISQAVFQKYTEPIFLLIAIPISLSQPIIFFMKDAFNPSPYDSFCLIDVYPRECLINEEMECLRGSKDIDELHLYLMTIPVAIQIAILIMAMLLIVHTSCVQKEDTKFGIAVQAIMYIIACLLTWGSASLYSLTESSSWSILSLLFFPLQGFLNLMIFMFHKIYAYKTFNNTLISTMDAVKLFFVRPDNFQDQYISGIEKVLTLNEVRKIQERMQRQEIFEEDVGSDLPSRAQSSKLSQGMVASVELSPQISASGDSKWDAIWSMSEDISKREIDSYIRRNQDLSIEDEVDTRFSYKPE
ncbi:hypothetical protein CTEN210_18569 [Chaetoceros tenuissimus]|uniref:Uncharacterized protein n=1 Tax=Chaetoceros tenuissimus TaxID=426638 RepID=A0AAD3DCY1_9STRA|nr:hypothetical protein CTEN210_18569 [Chaetoceros tenuissimus]